MNNENYGMQKQQVEASAASARSAFLTKDEISLLPVVLYNAPRCVSDSQDSELRQAYREAAPALYARRALITRLDQIVEHFQCYNIAPAVTRTIVESALRELEEAAAHERLSGP